MSIGRNSNKQNIELLRLLICFAPEMALFVITSALCMLDVTPYGYKSLKNEITTYVVTVESTLKHLSDYTSDTK